MNELRPCPFCGGIGKVSFKDYRFGGQNYKGDKKISYRVQVICNRCKSRGKPVVTKMLINPNPYFTKWGNCHYDMSERSHEEYEKFKPYVEEAIEAWNRRAEDGGKENG
jgi:RecJ-like exonuclease